MSERVISIKVLNMFIRQLMDDILLAAFLVAHGDDISMEEVAWFWPNVHHRLLCVIQLDDVKVQISQGASS